MLVDSQPSPSADRLFFERCRMVGQISIHFTPVSIQNKVPATKALFPSRILALNIHILEGSLLFSLHILHMVPTRKVKGTNTACASMVET
jgi:hypothetical protein